MLKQSNQTFKFKILPGAHGVISCAPAADRTLKSHTAPVTLATGRRLARAWWYKASAIIRHSIEWAIDTHLVTKNNRYGPDLTRHSLCESGSSSRRCSLV